MGNLWKVTTYGYLVIAAILFYKTFADWNTDRSRAYMTLGMGILAIIVFFIKRNFRKKIIERNKQNNTL